MMASIAPVSVDDRCLVARSANGFRLYEDYHSRVDLGWSLNLHNVELGETVTGLDPGQDTVFGFCACEHLPIAAARCICANPRNIMPMLAERGNRVTREVLVGQDTHRLRRYHGIDSFCLQSSAGVTQTGLHILMC